ncbi:MAG: NAD-dependent epimerase/dehydratase family protein [Planctomycetia bacterium]|nr:NAD-dependent epimerase/dehydratase family protein [Planctomycetia bacterium]
MNARPRLLITGATGFVGSHLAEAFRGRGHAVVALARDGSETAFLEQLGVTLQRGDLNDREAVARAVQDVEVVVHCAAKVGDWGPIEAYRAVNVEGLRNLLEACRGIPLRRFVHLSTLGVYAARHHYGTDESEPPPERHIDGYTQTKVEGERLVLEYHREHQLPAVVLRPGFVYGPRDRTVLPKLVASLKQRLVRYLGSRRRALNAIYVGNLTDAVELAIKNPQAVGRVYNLTDGEFVSKERFIGSIVRSLELPPPGLLAVPLWLARTVAFVLERQARLQRAPEPPALTQARIKFLGLNLDFSIERARQELGYRPRVSFDEGMARTMAWYREAEYNHPQATGPQSVA